MLGDAIGQPLALTVLRSEALVVDVIVTPEELRDGRHAAPLLSLPRRSRRRRSMPEPMRY
jgi:hypothetical protein